MIKKVAAVFLFTILLAGLLAGCFSRGGDQPQGATPGSYEDFAGKRIGVQSGEIYNTVASDLLHAGDVPEFSSMADLLESLRMGRLDAVLTDSSYIKPLQDSNTYPEFEYIWVPKEIFANESANVFHSEELRDQFNAWLADIVADGVLDEIVQRWMGVSLPLDEDVPRFESTGENGVLRVCDTGNFPPFTYFDSAGEPTGMDYEVISRFAQSIGKKLDLTMMDYAAIGPYVIAGKADMSACYLTVSHERGQSIIFGDPVISTQGVLIVPKTDGAASVKTTRSYTDFAGEKIAVITGVLTYNTTEKIGGIPVNYNDSSSAAEDVRNGRVAGFMHALTAVQVMAKQLDGFEVITIPKDIFAAQIGGISMDQDVIARFNNFLANLEQDGTLTEMQNRWFGDNLDLDAPLPEIVNTGENGIFKVAVCSDSIPYVYAGANGAFSGFSVELALRFGASEGKTVEFTDMEFGGLIPYIVSKKAEFGIANMAITEERKKSVLFTDPFFDEQHGILVLKQDGATATAATDAALPDNDFTGKKIGHETGSIWDQIIEGTFQGTPVYYTEVSVGVEDTRKNRIDGFVADLSAARVLVATKGNEDLVCVEVPAEIFSAPMGAISLNQDLVDRFNLFLAAIKADGTLAEMQNRWLETVPDLDSPMPDTPSTGTNGTLKVATTVGAVPFSYMGANAELKGYSIELVKRFAAFEGLKIEFADMDFAGLIPYVVSGKADMAIANISITEERKKSVLFTDSIYDDQGGMIMLKPTFTPAAQEYTDFAGKRIGVSTGTFFDSVTENVVNGIPVYYNGDDASLEDVRNGRIDGAMVDYSAALFMCAQPGNELFEAVEIPREIYSGPMGAISVNQEIIDRYNEFLAAIKADGTMTEMQIRWIEGNPGSDPPMPEIPLSGENGVIKVVTSGIALPFTYFGENGELKGYCVELALRFAAREGKTVEFSTTDFTGMIPFVVSGKADIGIDPMSITEERKKQVLFSDSHYDDRIGIVALKSTGNMASEPGPSFDYTSFKGKKMGIVTGTAVDKPAEEILGATPVYYLDSASAIEDIRNGRIDGLLYDLSSVQIIAGLPGNDDLICIAVPPEVVFVPLGAVASDASMISRFNAYLQTAESDGTLEEMQNRWLVAQEALAAPMPEIPLINENGTLKIAVDDAAIPFAYRGADGELKGFCIELGLRFAANEGMDVEFLPMDFSALIPYVGNGKADLGLDAITITGERQETILFSNPFYDGPLGILALRQENVLQPEKEAKNSFTAWLKTGVERNLITDNRWKMVLGGLGTTMTIALLAQIFGTILGCFVCYLLMRKNRLVKGLANFYCNLIHGTPVVVLLMITYYIIFGSSGISNVLVAIVAFTMVMGAGVAGDLKGAIDTVDLVEIEAARSIGFSAFKAFMTITLPQAVRRALPGYTNGFVELVKSTAIVGYIAIQDLTRAGDIIRSRTYDAYFPLLFVAVIYLIVTTICVLLFKIIVRKINGGPARDRRVKRINITGELERRALK